MVYPNSAEVDVVVEHFRIHENAHDKLNKYKNEYMELVDLHFSIEEFDNMLASGELRSIMYRADFSMTDEPFQSSIIEVVCEDDYLL